MCIHPEGCPSLRQHWGLLGRAAGLVLLGTRATWPPSTHTCDSSVPVLRAESSPVAQEQAGEALAGRTLSSCWEILLPHSTPILSSVLKSPRTHSLHFWSPRGLRSLDLGDYVKEPACQCWGHKRQGFCPWVEKMSWRKAWQPTPVFLPGESQGRRNLAGYSLQGCKEPDTTERLSMQAT